jgi:hypothetical protein
MHLHSEERHLKPKYEKLDFGDSYAATNGLLACISQGKLDPLDEASSPSQCSSQRRVKHYHISFRLRDTQVTSVVQHSVHQHVGQYDPTFVNTIDNFAALNQVEGNHSYQLNNKTLSELADWYVQVVLHINKANFRRFSLSQFFNITCAYKPARPDHAARTRGGTEGETWPRGFQVGLG